MEFDAGADRYLSYNAQGAAGTWDVHHVRGTKALRPLLFPRPGRFDSLLVEPGPPAIRTDDGIVLIYNGAEVTLRGRVSINVRYQPGQALFDPSTLFRRSPGPSLRSCAVANPRCCGARWTTSASRGPRAL